MLLLACAQPLADGPDDDKPGEHSGVDDTAATDTGDTGDDDTAVRDTGDTGDTGDCTVDWAYSGPTHGSELFSGTRYDWLLRLPEGASAAVDGQPCALVDASHALCALTLDGQRALALEVTHGACTVYEKLSVTNVTPEGVYPAGNRFPVMMYEATEDDMPTLAAAGVNVVQAYVSLDDDTYENFAAVAEANGVQVVGQVRDAADFDLLKADPRVAFWSLPEELRYWYEDEMATVTDLSSLIHAEDARPVYMYIPGHYPPDDILPYVPYLDLVGAGAYVEYSAQPHVWARWRAESEIEALEAAGYTTAERTPLTLPGTFDYEGQSPTADEAVHDSFAGIVGGALGWFPFAWWHARYDAGSTATEGLLWTAERLGGADAVGEWILHGEETTVNWRTVVGETEVSFTPMYLEERTEPAQAVRAWARHDELLVLVVNSSAEAATVHLTEMPGYFAWKLGTEEVLTGVTGDDGIAHTVSLDGLGVAVLRVPREP